MIDRTAVISFAEAGKTPVKDVDDTLIGFLKHDKNDITIYIDPPFYNTADSMVNPLELTIKMTGYHTAEEVIIEEDLYTLTFLKDGE